MICAVCGGGHRTAECGTFRNVRGTAESTDQPDSLVGRMLGSLRLIREIGSGTFARVFLAEHALLGTHFAVKVLRPDFQQDQTIVLRFVEEARTTSLVRHENVVEVYDIQVENPQCCYIVMEYLKGESLAARLAREPMDFSEACPLLLQVCNALNTAHELGVVHRDLKPQNVYLVRDRRRPRVKIVDFGVARRQAGEERPSLTMAGELIGTPQYMAPEQAWGLPVDHRSDIYALGVVVYQIATRRLPFEADSLPALLTAVRERPPPLPRELEPAVPEELERVILRALEKDPADRFQSMADFGRALARAYQAYARRFLSSVPPGAFGHEDGAEHVRLGRPRSEALLPAFEEHGADASARSKTIQVTGGAPWVDARTEPVDPRLPQLFRVRVDWADGRPPVGASVLSVDAESMRLAYFGQLPEQYMGLVIFPDVPDAAGIPAEVVRVIDSFESADQYVPPGFQIAFVRTPGDRAQAAAIAAMLKLASERGQAPLGDDRRLFHILARIEGVPEGDPYLLLEVPENVSARAAQVSVLQLYREIVEAARSVTLDTALKQRIDRARERLAMAEELLLDPKRRAAYDARRGNFAGVAEALLDGLTGADVETLRQKLWAERPEAIPILKQALRDIEQHESGGQRQALVRALEIALRIDPLNLKLHHRYWRLRRRPRSG